MSEEITRYGKRKRRNDKIRDRVDSIISQMPVKSDIYTRVFAQNIGKVCGHDVEPSHMRVFLRERDDLVYDKDHYVKVR